MHKFSKFDFGGMYLHVIVSTATNITHRQIQSKCFFKKLKVFLRDSKSTSSTECKYKEYKNLKQELFKKILTYTLYEHSGL